MFLAVKGWRSQLLSGRASLGLLSGLSSAATFAFVVIAGRRLSPQEYGSFMALFSLWSMVAVPTTALQLVAAQHLAGHGQPAGTQRPIGFVRQFDRLVWQSSGIWLIPALLIAFTLSRTLHLTVVVLALTLSLAFSLSLAVAWRRGRVQAQHHLGRFGASQAVEASVRLATFVVLTTTPLQVDALFLICMGVPYLAVPLVLPRHRLELDAGPVALNELVPLVSAALVFALATGLITSLDALWGKHALSSAAAGVFAAGALGSRPFTLVGMVLSTVMLPQLSTGRYTLQAQLQMVALTTLGTAILASVLSLLAAPLVEVAFGASYQAAIPLFRMACWGGALFAPSLLLATLFLGAGQRRGVFWFAVAGILIVGGVFGFAHHGDAYWRWFMAVWGTYLCAGSWTLWNAQGGRA